MLWINGISKEEALGSATKGVSGFLAKGVEQI